MNKASEASAEINEQTWQMCAAFAARKRRASWIRCGSQVLSLETAISAAAPANIARKASAAPNAKYIAAEERAPIRLRSIVALVSTPSRDDKTASPAPQLINIRARSAIGTESRAASLTNVRTWTLRGALSIFAVQAVMPFPVFYRLPLIEVFFKC